MAAARGTDARGSAATSSHSGERAEWRWRMWESMQPRAIAPPDSLRGSTPITIDPAVLGFSLLKAAPRLRGALWHGSGLYRLSRPGLHRSTGARQAAMPGLVGGGKLRNAVAVTQVALAFVLLIGSGLMFRSFLALQQVNPGFDPQGLPDVSAAAQRGQPTLEQRAAFQQNVSDRLAAIPGRRREREGGRPCRLPAASVRSDGDLSQRSRDPSRYRWPPISNSFGPAILKP